MNRDLILWVACIIAFISLVYWAQRYEGLAKKQTKKASQKNGSRPQGNSSAAQKKVASPQKKTAPPQKKAAAQKAAAQKKAAAAQKAAAAARKAALTKTPKPTTAPGQRKVNITTRKNLPPGADRIVKKANGETVVVMKDGSLVRYPKGSAPAFAPPVTPAATVNPFTPTPQPVPQNEVTQPGVVESVYYEPTQAAGYYDEPTQEAAYYDEPTQEAVYHEEPAQATYYQEQSGSSEEEPMYYDEQSDYGDESGYSEEEPTYYDEQGGAAGYSDESQYSNEDDASLYDSEEDTGWW